MSKPWLKPSRQKDDSERRTAGMNELTCHTTGDNSAGDRVLNTHKR
jgi:hypothetical protein